MENKAIRSKKMLNQIAGVGIAYPAEARIREIMA